MPRQMSVECPDIADYLDIASEATGTDVKTLAIDAKPDLADSAVQAPSASFGNESRTPDMGPRFTWSAGRSRSRP